MSAFSAELHEQVLSPEALPLHDVSANTKEMHPTARPMVRCAETTQTEEHQA